MYDVYEVFKEDGKKFWRYKHVDLLTCQVWVRNHACEEKTVLEGSSFFQIEERP